MKNLLQAINNNISLPLILSVIASIASFLSVYFSYYKYRQDNKNTDKEKSDIAKTKSVLIFSNFIYNNNSFFNMISRVKSEYSKLNKNTLNMSYEDSLNEKRDFVDKVNKLFSNKNNHILDFEKNYFDALLICSEKQKSVIENINTEIIEYIDLIQKIEDALLYIDIYDINIPEEINILTNKNPNSLKVLINKLVIITREELGLTNTPWYKRDRSTNNNSNKDS